MARILTEKLESDVGVRCIEYHHVRPGGSLPDPKHHDVGSLVTIDVLLCEPTDFTGGEFTTLEHDGRVQLQQFGGRERSAAGDGILFVSHKYHSVRAVTSGTRRVLVIELWVGPDTTCNHRCVVVREGYR
jgi:predicted 2-oxoglutarate/Fe(II)-dependent dioxygenase YbiX